MLIAVVCALAAGACFASAGVLQQRAASARPETESLSFRLIADLAHEPLWLVGIGLAMLSYVFESVALAFGPLVLVQPLIVTELLFALPISLRWRGMRMSVRDWVGTLSVACGLSVGLVAAAPAQGTPNASLVRWIPALAIAAGLTMVAVAIGRRVSGPWRSSSYAAGAGLVLGSQAALLKATVALFERGIVTALTSWQLWAMVAAAIIGLLLVQSAYEAGPLAASMPVVDAVDPAVAVLFGILLFHEHVRTGIWLAGVATGVVLLIAGIVLLDTSPVIQCLQKVERRQRDARPAGPAEQRPVQERAAETPR